jgi:hypothetical protein
VATACEVAGDARFGFCGRGEALTPWTFRVRVRTNAAPTTSVARSVGWACQPTPPVVVDLGFLEPLGVALHVVDTRR